MSSSPLTRFSLRTRLVAATTALLALAFLVVGVTSVVSLRRALYDRIDAQLSAAAKRNPHTGPHSCESPPKQVFPAGQTIGTLSARICDGTVTDARILVESGEPEPNLEPLYPEFLTIGPGDPRTYEFKDFGEYRVMAQIMPDGAVLITGLPLAATQETLYRVSGIVVTVSSLALLTIAFAGAFIVRRALRPLSRVAATATRVSQVRLDRGEVELPQRVDPAGTDERTEVGQVGAALNRMLDHVAGALEARHASETRVRQFVADASHELRTPLASIRGYAELSRRAGSHDLPHMLRRIESEAKRMSLLVDDLLLLARLDSGRPLAREPVDLSRLVVDAVSDAHAAGPDHDWRLDLPEDPVEVTGDRARLHQVVANLLVNARSHTPEGTTVTVGVSTSGGEAILRVTDNGPGIPQSLRPHIFERFARGDSSRSRKAGGTGLGLAIVQAVVAAHGGTVEVASTQGNTSFTVRLPRRLH